MSSSTSTSATLTWKPNKTVNCTSPSLLSTNLKSTNSQVQSSTERHSYTALFFCSVPPLLHVTWVLQFHPSLPWSTLTNKYLLQLRRAAAVSMEHWISSAVNLLFPLPAESCSPVQMFPWISWATLVCNVFLWKHFWTWLFTCACTVGLTVEQENYFGSLSPAVAIPGNVPVLTVDWKHTGKS